MRRAKPKVNKLEVGKILAEFREIEQSPAHRRGTFKIDVPFEDALEKILKAKPGSKLTDK